MQYCTSALNKTKCSAVKKTERIEKQEDLLEARHGDVVLQFVARPFGSHLIVDFAGAEENSLDAHRVLECGALLGDDALEARIADKVVERAAGVVMTEKRLGCHHNKLHRIMYNK